MVFLVLHRDYCPDTRLTETKIVTAFDNEDEADGYAFRMAVALALYHAPEDPELDKIWTANPEWHYLSCPNHYQLPNYWQAVRIDKYLKKNLPGYEVGPDNSVGNDSFTVEEMTIMEPDPHEYTSEDEQVDTP